MQVSYCILLYALDINFLSPLVYCIFSVLHSIFLHSIFVLFLPILHSITSFFCHIVSFVSHFSFLPMLYVFTAPPLATIPQYLSPYSSPPPHTFACETSQPGSRQTAGANIHDHTSILKDSHLISSLVAF